MVSFWSGWVSFKCHYIEGQQSRFIWHKSWGSYAIKVGVRMPQRSVEAVELVSKRRREETSLVKLSWNLKRRLDQGHRALCGL